MAPESNNPASWVLGLFAVSTQSDEKIDLNFMYSVQNYISLFKSWIFNTLYCYFGRTTIRQESPEVREQNIFVQKVHYNIAEMHYSRMIAGL